MRKSEMLSRGFKIVGAQKERRRIRALIAPALRALRMLRNEELATGSRPLAQSLAEVMSRLNAATKAPRKGKAPG